jgi:hypothetical protein
MPAVFDGFAGGVDRLAQVAERAAAHAAGVRVVLVLLDVARGLVHQVDRAVQPVALVAIGVDRRVIGQRLAVIDRGVLDVVERGSRPT